MERWHGLEWQESLGMPMDARVSMESIGLEKWVGMTMTTYKGIWDNGEHVGRIGR
jgi:hypothetical protein